MLVKNPCVRSARVTFFRVDSPSPLVTSSVSYCEPPETLLIQQFDIAYFAANASISFNISAASVVHSFRVSKSTAR